MRLTVRPFAQLRERLGTGTLEVELPSGATAAELLELLLELPLVLLLRPFGFTTLSVWVYELASENFWERAALPALLIVLVAVVPVALTFRNPATRHAR